MSQASSADNSQSIGTRDGARVAITLLGREYFVACNPGQEQELHETVKLVEGKLRDVAAHGSVNASESSRFMLACLMLADELIETRRITAGSVKADEDLLVAAVDHLRDRVEAIARQVGKA